MNTDALRKRVDRMIAAIEQQQVDNMADEFEQQRAALVSEGLVRRFALITPDHKLPDDFEKQCTLIDQDIERRKTPGIRVAEQRFEQEYAGQLSTARDELIRRLEAMHEAMHEAEESEGSAA